MQLISDYAVFPLMFVPFATSIVLVMGTPTIEPSQPRALVGGHLIATLVGLLVVKLIGPSEWAAAVAVGLSMAAMHLTRTFHPPAGIDPLIVVVYDKTWDFFLAPVALGACLLAAFAFAWHNLVARGSWPQRWW
jgi:CBS-domain-containing membrane protein